MAKNQYDELTEQQALFVEHYLMLNNGTLAAIKAGYGEKGAHVQASRLLKNAKIRDYIEELRTERREAIMNELANMASDALTVVYKLAMDDDAPEAVRLQASKDILDRSGYKPVEKRENKDTLDGKIEFGFVDPTAKNDE